MALAAILLLVGAWVRAPRIVNAAATITVNSTSDATANDGACTLREAIIAADNDTASGGTTGECIAGNGDDTINFNITGAADFTVTDRNGVVKNGYTISPTSDMPYINTTVTVNGYSQPGSMVNTAAAPLPLNGTLLIEINGQNAGNVGNGLTAAGNGVVVRGLIVNDYENQGLGIAGNNTVVQGNYLGTDPTGLIDRGNGTNGVGLAEVGSTDALIGGLNAEDRNLISANKGGGSSPNTGCDRWTYQGNYIGVDKTGMAALPNAMVGGSGALSLDNSNGHIVGGPQATAINVISGNTSHGIAPHNSDDLLIEGNYIGLGYDGTTVLGNGSGSSGAGVTISDSDDVVVKNNIIAGSARDGIYAEASDNVVVTANEVFASGINGIYLAGVTNAFIGAPAEGNYIYGSRGVADIYVTGISGFGFPSDGVKVQSNNVGFDAEGNVPTDRTAGIVVMGDAQNVLIGGSGPGEGNDVRSSLGAGIAVMSLEVSTFSITIPAQKVSVLGNTISGTDASADLPTPVGIDLLTGVDTNGPPDGIPNTYTLGGPTLNDPSDADTGPNNYINFPVLNSAKQTGTSLALNYDLDATDSPTDEYRVEFFANDTADPSGYGEGQTFLGVVTATNGNGNTATLTLPSGTDLTGKVLSATTTAVDNTTDSGFGSTSEFSAVLGAEVIAVQTATPPSGSNAGSLSETGQRVFSALALVVILVGSIVAVVRVSRKKHNFKV